MEWSGWSGVDTPQTVMTTKAPAALINNAWKCVRDLKIQYC